MKNLEIKVYLTNLGKYNEGCLIGEWLSLPTSEEEINKTLSNIGINEKYEEWFLTDWESDLGIEVGEYTNIFELNKKINEINDMDIDIDVLKAYMELSGEDDLIEADLWELENKINDLTIIHLDDSLTLSDEENLAYNFIDEIYGDISNISDGEKENYFSIENYKRDLELEGIMSDDEIESWIDEIENCGVAGLLSKETLESYFDYESYGRNLKMDFYIAENNIAISNY